jgi:3D (Asp-Asp-Asp) domain-containing protein
MAKWKDKQAHLKPPQGKFVINASAYTAAADECGKSDGITASGIKVQKERTLACPPNFPFGTKIRIEGMGVRVCEDRGGAIKGNHIDIYMETKAEAFQFGRRNLEAEVVG